MIHTVWHASCLGVRKRSAGEMLCGGSISKSAMKFGEKKLTNRVEQDARSLWLGVKGKKI